MTHYFWSIRFRLWCLAALFLIPQIFQTSIILRRAQTDISFAEKELIGSAYLKAVWPLKLAVDDATASLLPLQKIEPLLSTFANVQAAHDATLESAAESDAVMKAFRAGGSMRDFDRINSRLFALMTRVGDKSNLILDPDLDTYYLMSLVVERLPELSREASRALLAFEMLRKEGRTAEGMDDLKFAEASFVNVVEKVAHGVRLSLSGTEDPSLQSRIAAPYANFTTTSRVLSDVLKKAGARLEVGNPISGELSDQAKAGQAAFKARLDEVYILTMTELERLLAARISRFEDARNRDLAMVGISVLLALGIAILLSSTIMGQLSKLRTSLEVLASGDFSAKIAALDRKDELGGLARAVERLRATITAKLKEDFSAEKVDIIRVEQRRVIASMAADLDRAVTGSVLTIDSLGAELSQTVGFVSNSTAATRRAINSSVEALDGSVANVRAATISLSELAMSVSEISGQAARAADATRVARQRALDAKTRSSELDKTVSEIQTSAKLVESIAAQTNLLALNATIEAARAGEAGRGFAIVAQEVKSLAAQSARTTAEIQARIIAVSQVSHAVTTAIDEMGATIDRMDEVSLSIAAAVEQHNVTTAEITARVQETADGADKVASQISDVSSMADSTDEVAASLTELAVKLSEEANALRRESTTFMARLVA